MTDTESAAPPTEDGNAKAYSVSELSFALKRTLEDAYGFVRVRAEVSKVTRHASGHVYLTLKDERSAIDGVVWKGQVRSLQVQPEQGMEVIVTGRITTFPASSKYQIVVETMAPAGVGALLAQLERLKAKLHGEGLFDPARKKRLPSMPATIGVITSPTGAVIRDILHRIRDRWPCRVIVWPVVVQGDAASVQVRAAIEGFNALTGDSAIPRPDLLIVARGGGSVEDLWAFNDEALARAVAASTIPLISAVGHETDTTLIDFVSDRRAPTPTAAAEMATPVLAELRAAVADYQRRMVTCTERVLEVRRNRLLAAARGLPRPEDVLALARQRFDLVGGRLDSARDRNVAIHAQALTRTAARLNPALLERPRAVKAQRLADVSGRLGSALQKNSADHARELARISARFAAAAVRGPERAAQQARLPQLDDRLQAAFQRRVARAQERLVQLDKLRQSLNPERPLDLGFALVRKADGVIARSADALASGEAVTLKFKSGERGAVIDGTPGAALPPPVAAPTQAARPKLAAKPSAAPSGQGDLF